jgi:hypothetical protein
MLGVALLLLFEILLPMMLLVDLSSLYATLIELYEQSAAAPLIFFPGAGIAIFIIGIVVPSLIPMEWTQCIIQLFVLPVIFIAYQLLYEYLCKA